MHLTREQAESRITSGDFVFMRGRRLFSWLIKLWTRSRLSHVGIFVWIESAGTRRLCVIEALEGRGVQLLPFSEILRRDRSVDYYAIAPGFDGAIDRERIVAYALDQLGKQYACPLQLLRSFSCIGYWICDRLGLSPDLDADRFFCSEFAVNALENGGYRDSDCSDPAFMSPGDVAELTCLHRVAAVIP